MTIKKEIRHAGIDISKWNGNIDFEKVKKAGIGFVIIKAGGSDKGLYRDPKFEDNYRLAKLAGLQVGAYYFVGNRFTNIDAGIEDAKRFRHILDGKQFDYPVYVDIETTPPELKEEATDAAIAFCEFMQMEKYYVGIYASDVSGFKEKLNLKRLNAYDKWVAKYSTSAPSYVKKYGIWQYSSKGQIDGIDGYVDLDISFMDYSNIINSHGLNRG